MAAAKDAENSENTAKAEEYHREIESDCGKDRNALQFEQANNYSGTITEISHGSLSAFYVCRALESQDASH